MKKNQLIIVVSLFVFSCSTKAKDEINKTEKPLTIETVMNKRQLRHVVLFKFKDSITAEAIHKAEKAFITLPNKISEIKDFEWGINNSPEGLDKGFTHCFFLTFDSEEDRAIYLPHPDHKAFGEILSPLLDDVLVIDYWTGN